MKFKLIFNYFINTMGGQQSSTKDPTEKDILSYL